MLVIPTCCRESNRYEGQNFFSVSSALQVFFLSPQRASCIFIGSCIIQSFVMRARSLGQEGAPTYANFLMFWGYVTHGKHRRTIKENCKK